MYILTGSPGAPGCPSIPAGPCVPFFPLIPFGPAMPVAPGCPGRPGCPGPPRPPWTVGKEAGQVQVLTYVCTDSIMCNPLLIENRHSAFSFHPHSLLPCQEQRITGSKWTNFIQPRVNGIYAYVLTYLRMQ